MEKEPRKNTNRIVLTLDDISLKRFRTVPTFKQMLYPNQLDQLKVGDNELVVNNTILGKLERMQGPGSYTLTKIKITKESIIKLIKEVISEKIWKNLKEDTQKGYVLQDLEDKYDIKLELYDNGQYLTLDKIEIPKDKRGQGIGSEIIKSIIDYADSNNRPIYLTPSKDLGATSVDRLEKFYKKFGFKNKDKSDFSSRDRMVRLPISEYVKPAEESKVDPLELKKGIEVEMEHTYSSKVAKRIALQHLAEDPKYYTKLGTLKLEERDHNLEIEELLAEKQPGLWANIRAKRARGEKPAHKNSKAHKDAVAAGKKINKDTKLEALILQEQDTDSETEDINSIPDKAIIYHDFQGVDISNPIPTGTEKILKVKDCIGNEPGKDYNYFTTEKKEYVDKMIKDASGDGWKKFPPIVAIEHPLVSGKYLVIDGNHRLGAFKIGKIPSINAVVISPNKILLAKPGVEWEEGKVPETIPLSDAEGKVNFEEYFSTEELQIPTSENLAEGKLKIRRFKL
jgi:predicted GNAT family acetyltransferase